MKLPGIKYDIRAQLPKESPGQASRLFAAKSKAISTVFGGAQDVINKIEETKTRSAISGNNADMAIYESDHTKQWAGKTYAEGEEIPEYLGIDRTDAEGKPRQVPLSEIYPDMYRKDMTEKMNALAANIPNERAREQWINESTEQIEDQYQRSLITAASQVTKEAAAFDKMQASKLVGSGLYDAAREVISSSENLSASDKEQSIYTVDNHERDAITAQSESVIESLSSEASRQARSGGFEDAKQTVEGIYSQYEAMVDLGLITRSEANTGKGEIYREVQEQSFRHNFERIAKERGADAALDALKSVMGKPPKGFSGDEWLTYTTSQFSELNRWKKLEDKAKDKEVSVNSVEQFINGDKRAVITQKDVNEFYDEKILPVIDGIEDFETKSAVIGSFVEKVKLIPSALRDQLSHNIRQRDPELAAEALSVARRIDEVPGVSDDPVSTNERAFAEQFVELSKSMNAEEAYTLAAKNTDPKNKGIVEAANQEVKEEFKGKNKAQAYQNEAVDIFSSFWRFDPTADINAAAQMGKEFGAAYEANRQAGMSERQARDAAKGVIQRNWSEWEGRIAKYSPAVYYGMPDGNNTYIKKDLIKSVNEQSAQPVEFENIIVGFDDRTSRESSEEGGAQPSYPVGIILPTGELFWYPTSGLGAVRWRPDQQAESQRRRAANEARIRNERATKPPSIMTHTRGL